MNIANGSTTDSKTMVLSTVPTRCRNRLQADSARQGTDHVKDAGDRSEISQPTMCKFTRSMLGSSKLTEHSEEEVGTKVLVSNVHYDLTKEDLTVRRASLH